MSDLDTMKFYPGPITDEQLPLIADVAKRLDHSFDWDHTPQGFEFWDGVYDALVELSKQSHSGKAR